MRVDSSNDDDNSSTSSSQDLVHTPNGEISTDTFTILPSQESKIINHENSEFRNPETRNSETTVKRKTTDLSNSDSTSRPEFETKLETKLGLDKSNVVYTSSRIKRHKQKIKKDTYDLPKTTRGWISLYFRKYSIIISLFVCGCMIWLFTRFKNQHPELVQAKPSQVMSNYKMPENFTENSIRIQDSGRIDTKDYYQKNRDKVYHKWNGK